MANVLSPNAKQQFFSNDGKPLVGGLLFSYAAGSSTKVDTFTGPGAGTNTNPIELNFRGECDLWLVPNFHYKLVLSPATDTDPPTNPIWTVDDVVNAQLLSLFGGVDTGSANAYVITFDANFDTLTDGIIIYWVPSNTNTGPSTLNVNGLGPIDIENQDGTPTYPGEIKAGQVQAVIYLNGKWRLLLVQQTTTIRNAWAAGNADTFVTVTDAATTIFDTALANAFKWTMGGSRLVQIDNPLDGSWLDIYMTQDGTGGWQPTWPANVAWVSGQAPKINGEPGTTSRVFLRYELVTTTYWGWTAGNSAFTTVIDAATTEIRCAIGNVFAWTIGGNRTVDVLDEADGTGIELYITQDGTGGRTVTWPANVVWVGGAAPVLSSAPGAVDKVFLRYELATDTFYGDFNLGFSAGDVSLNVSGNSHDMDIYALAGSPVAPVTVTVTVSTGVVITASSPATYAMSFVGFVIGSTININNRGYIQGHGGKGGRGGLVGDVASANIYAAGTDGSDAGAAIGLPFAAVTTNIDNGSGFIWGGGGGGGGGGPSGDADGSNVGQTGGGGGGGAGAGVPGDPGSLVAASGTPGVYGGSGPNGTFGAGGTGEDTGGTGDAATGGDGGDWGADGDDGQTQTGHTFDAPPGVGGVAGKAIDVNGAGAPTFSSGSGSPNVLGSIS
jgi:hypothetical protein